MTGVRVTMVLYFPYSSNRAKGYEKNSHTSLESECQIRPTWYIYPEVVWGWLHKTNRNRIRQCKAAYT